MKIDFEKPPINEVSIGMQFAPLPNLRSEHIGLFWNRVRAAFPNSQQNLPFGPLAQVPLEIFPMPRFWFIAKDDATLIQVHRNAFLFNWRLRAEEYPRFESVFEAFQKHRSTFIQFLKEDLNTAKIEQPKYQLNYVNVFEEVPYWSGPEDTPKIVPSFAFVNPGLKSAKPKDFNSATIFQVEDDLLLSVAARNGLNNTTGKMALVLELDDIDGSGFRLRENETNLSFNWMEYCRNHSPDEQIQLIRDTFPLKLKKKDKFVKLNVSDAGSGSSLTSSAAPKRP